MEAMESAPVTQEAAPVETPEVKQETEKRRYKVDGEDKEIDVETLIKERQKYEAADKRFREASEIKKKYSKYEEFEKALQQKDLKILSKYVDQDTIRKFSEEQLIEFLEYQGLSDAEKKNLEYEKRLKEFENEKAEKEAREQEERRLQVNHQAVAMLDNEISNTFKELGVKPTPAIIMRTAMHMEAALSQDPPVFMSGKEAYKRASLDLKKDLTGYFEAADVNEVVDSLPKSIIDAIRKRSLDQTQSFERKDRSKPTETSSSNGKIRATTDDYFKQLDKKFLRR